MATSTIEHTTSFKVGQALDRQLRRVAEGEQQEALRTYALQRGYSTGYCIRALSHYRLFIKALELPAAVFHLGPTALDTLRKAIDWDYNTQTVGAGLGGKWDKTEARRRILKIMREHGLVD